MMVKVTIEAQDGLDMLDALDAIVLSDDLGSAAGAFAAQRILSRTLSGKDVNDSPFASYSRSYSKQKEGVVNLLWSGEMLGSIDYQASGSSVSISCKSQTAEYHEKGTKKMPQRRFIGLSANDVQDLVRELVEDPLDSLVG